MGVRYFSVPYPYVAFVSLHFWIAICIWITSKNWAMGFSSEDLNTQLSLGETESSDQMWCPPKSTKYPFFTLSPMTWVPMKDVTFDGWLYHVRSSVCSFMSCLVFSYQFIWHFNIIDLHIDIILTYLCTHHQPQIQYTQATASTRSQVKKCTPVNCIHNEMSFLFFLSKCCKKNTI